MRICYVYDAVYPWEMGGVQKRVWEFARRLADDHEVHWYGLQYWDGPPVIERENVTLHGVGSPPELYVDGRRSITEALSFSARLARPLLNREFDIVDCQEFPYFPAFPSKLQTVGNDATMVLTWHEVWGDYWYEYLGWKGWFGKRIEWLTARLPRAHLAVSERTRRELGTLGVRDAHLLPNGIDMDEIAAVNPSDRAVDVLYVGRLIPEKNVELLVRAVAKLREEWPDIQCVIVGEGPRRTTIETLIDTLDVADSVSLLGTLEDHDDVLGLMKAAETVALPSRREGFGIVALEALACGTPVVTAAHEQNAAADLIEDGVTGRVCEPTPSAFVEGLENAPTLSGADCVAVAREYDWDRLTERLETVYREVA